MSAPTVEKVIESANSYISISSDHVKLDFGIDDQRMHDNAIKLSLETHQACYIQKIKEEKNYLRVLAIGVAIAKCYRVRNTTLSEKFLLKDGDRVSIPKSFVSKFDSIEQITDSITNGWTKNQNFIECEKVTFRRRKDELEVSERLDYFMKTMWLIAASSGNIELSFSSNTKYLGTFDVNSGIVWAEKSFSTQSSVSCSNSFFNIVAQSSESDDEAYDVNDGVSEGNYINKIVDKEKTIPESVQPWSINFFPSLSLSNIFVIFP